MGKEWTISDNIYRQGSTESIRQSLSSPSKNVQSDNHYLSQYQIWNILQIHDAEDVFTVDIKA